MATDELAANFARPSVAMVLDMQDEQICILHKKGFHLPAIYQCWKLIENEMYSLFSKMNLSQEGLRIASYEPPCTHPCCISIYLHCIYHHNLLLCLMNSFSSKSCANKNTGVRSLAMLKGRWKIGKPAGNANKNIQSPRTYLEWHITWDFHQVKVRYASSHWG